MLTFCALLLVWLVFSSLSGTEFWLVVKMGPFGPAESTLECVSG